MFLFIQFCLLVILQAKTQKPYKEPVFPNIFNDGINLGYRLNLLQKIDISLVENETSSTISSNHTLQVNNTYNNSDCTRECWVNCQRQFTDLIEVKFCIINVCHCEIIQEDSTYGATDKKEDNKETVNTNNDNQAANTVLLQLPEGEIVGKGKYIIGRFPKGNGKIFAVFPFCVLFFFGLYEMWVLYYFLTSNNKIEEDPGRDRDRESELANLYQKLIDEEKNNEKKEKNSN